MLVTIVAGARPNFMKIAPIIKAICKAQESQKNVSYRLVHTGQHYDKGMSGDFFTQLNIPLPDVDLGARGGSQAEQTAAIMIGFEKELLENPTDVVLVVGDVTSTMACTITAKKLCIPVVHVEAGIRSGDRTMPEEINRIVTDSICDHFFTTSALAGDHLLYSGVPRERIHFVGNTMIDTLCQNLSRLRKPPIWDVSGLAPGEYYLLTLHRPSNVDEPANLQKILEVILDHTTQKVVFPIHPRTRKSLEAVHFSHDRLLQAEPMSYLEFIYLTRACKGVITDSGGITEETTVLGVPCITLRDSTERPETIEVGTNELAGASPSALPPLLAKIAAGKWKKGGTPELWDGHASERIVAKLLTLKFQRT